MNYFKSNPGLIVFLFVFGVIGILTLFFARAASPLKSSIEPENGIITGNAHVETDNFASGGKYTLFSAPALCPTGQTGTPPNCTTPSSGTQPTVSNTGPAAGTTFTDIPASAVMNGGTFTNCRITDQINYSSSTPLILRNCIASSMLVSTSADLTLDHVRMNGSVYWEAAAHGTISYSSFSGTGQALRPKPVNYGDVSTLTPLLVENSYLYDAVGVPPQHVEAMQSLGGNGYTFRNVTFVQAGPYNNTQTAVINHWANNTLFEDCYFIGGENAYYTIYAQGVGNSFIRPRISKGMASYFYPDDVDKPNITSPMDLNGNPITVNLPQN